MHSRSFAPRPTRRRLIAGALMAVQDSLCPAPHWPGLGGRHPRRRGRNDRSQTREAFRAEIEEELGYTEPATPGASFIDSNVNDIQTIHPLLADDDASLASWACSTTDSWAATSAPVSRRRPASPTTGRSPRTAGPTPFTSTRTRSGTTARTSPPMTCSSPSTPWPTPRSALPTHRASSTRPSHGG